MNHTFFTWSELNKCSEFLNRYNSSLEDGGSYREDSHKFVIDTNTGDMTGVAKVEVTVGGSTVVYGYGEGVDQQIDPTGRIEVTVPSAGGARQQVVVTGIDGSGNPSAEYRFRVQVTTNKLLLFLNNAKALFASIGSLILLLILLTVLLIVRRRIKRQVNK